MDNAVSCAKDEYASKNNQGQQTKHQAEEQPASQKFLYVVVTKDKPQSQDHTGKLRHPMARS
jgi:hypothetical protein